MVVSDMFFAVEKEKINDGIKKIFKSTYLDLRWRSGTSGRRQADRWRSVLEKLEAPHLLALGTIRKSE